LDTGLAPVPGVEVVYRTGLAIDEGSGPYSGFAFRGTKGLWKTGRKARPRNPTESGGCERCASSRSCPPYYNWRDESNSPGGIGFYKLL